MGVKKKPQVSSRDLGHFNVSLRQLLNRLRLLHAVGAQRLDVVSTFER